MYFLGLFFFFWVNYFCMSIRAQQGEFARADRQFFISFPTIENQSPFIYFGEYRILLLCLLSEFFNSVLQLTHDLTSWSKIATLGDLYKWLVKQQPWAFCARSAFVVRNSPPILFHLQPPHTHFYHCFHSPAVLLFLLLLDDENFNDRKG